MSLESDIESFSDLQEKMLVIIDSLSLGELANTVDEFTYESDIDDETREYREGFKAAGRQDTIVKEPLRKFDVRPNFKQLDKLTELVDKMRKLLFVIQAQVPGFSMEYRTAIAKFEKYYEKGFNDRKAGRAPRY